MASKKAQKKTAAKVSAKEIAVGTSTKKYADVKFDPAKIVALHKEGKNVSQIAQANWLPPSQWTTQWFKAKILRKLGATRIGSTPAQVKKIFERVAQAMSDTGAEVVSYIKKTLNLPRSDARCFRNGEKAARFPCNDLALQPVPRLSC